MVREYAAVRFEISLPALRDALSQVPEVAFAYLFGSAARGKHFRDLDVAVYLVPCPSSSYERFKLAMRIARRLERSLQPRCEVDVRVLNEAPVLFRYEVLRTGQLLFERYPDCRRRCEAQFLSDYLDYQPVWASLVRQHFSGDGKMEQQHLDKLDTPPEMIQHLEEMSEALADWERYQAGISLDQMRTHRDTRNMVLHAMLLSIQASIDIANYLIAHRGLRTPATYREAFEILIEAALLPSELGEELADLAGFRNVLVHLYWRLDLQRVYEILQQGLAPLRRFQAIVRQLLSAPHP
jgi:uncharacterized protein YutE (UPF0331/DUF86 family)/predicted nucleotidyltransferase